MTSPSAATGVQPASRNDPAGLLALAVLLTALTLTCLVLLQSQPGAAVFVAAGTATPAGTGGVRPATTDSFLSDAPAAGAPRSAVWISTATALLGALAGAALISLLQSRPFTTRLAPALRDFAGPSQPARLLAALPVGVLLLDSDERLLFANPAARRLLGLRPQAAGGCALGQSGCRQELAREIRRLHAACRAKRHAATGATEPPCTTATALPDGGGSADLRTAECDPASVGGVRLVPLPATAGMCALMIEDSAREHAAERKRDEFLAHVAHELRTPLTCIRAYTETLHSDFFSDPETQRRCYGIIMRETERLAHLVEDVLQLSQLEAGAAQDRPVTIPLPAALREALEELQPEADRKGIELILKAEAGGPGPVVLGDWRRLHQVWTNLLANAIKYSPSGQAVTTRIGSSEDSAWVEIEDRGIGIAAEFHERIFEKFYRVPDAAVQVETGTGLGLPIVREIVHRYGGEIMLSSMPGRGTTFRIVLPLAPALDSDSEEELSHGPHPGG